MKIIKLGKEDIKEALHLVWVVFEEFEAPDYPIIGIEEFKRFISYNSIINRMENGDMQFWGCRDNADNILTGVIASRDISHISLLFVKKEHHRKGIARKLFETVIEECKNQGNTDKITVNSSPYAVEVYHRLGFVDTAIEKTIKGITFTPMAYMLNDGAHGGIL